MPFKSFTIGSVANQKQPAAASKVVAYGQSQPQWKVVLHVARFSQTKSTPLTTILTPTKPGFYRLSAYISGSGATEDWIALFNLYDVTGTSQTLTLKGTLGQLSYLFVPEPGLPVTCEVVGSSGEYNIVATIEKLSSD